MKGLTVVEHPLLARALTHLRAAETPSPQFRRWIDDAASLLAFEVTRTLETKSVRIRTPLTQTAGVGLKRDVVLVPILRAGVAMLDAFLRAIPDASVGFVGQKRDEATLEAHTYICNLPRSVATADVIVLDPMLATGGSACSTLTLLRERGARHLRFASLLAAPEGVRRVRRVHPEVPIFTASLDQKLNSHGFIVPGLGDAGDRAFGT
jgi:uracil phosphoribosyltransferase